MILGFPCIRFSQEPTIRGQVTEVGDKYISPNSRLAQCLFQPHSLIKDKTFSKLTGQFYILSQRLLTLELLVQYEIEGETE